MEKENKIMRYNHLLAEMDALYHKAALKQGLSDSTMMILYTAVQNEDHTCLIGRLTDMGMSKQTINSALRKLEKEGILYLETADGKAKRICLTEKGNELTRGTVEKMIAAENRALASWTPEEWELYLELSERYLRAFEKEMEL